MQTCQDSGAQVLYTVNADGTAYCGCCGQYVATFVRPGDTNRIRFYQGHAA